MRTYPPYGGTSHASVTLPPARAKFPLHKRSLCNGCISLSNAEGFKRREYPPETVWIMLVKSATMTVKNTIIMPKMMSL